MNEIKNTPNQIRDLLIKAIDALLSEPPLTEEYETCMETINNRLFWREQIFTLDHIAFGAIAQRVYSKEFRATKSELLMHKNRLLGERNRWSSYALKHKFLDLLEVDELETYAGIKQVLGILKSSMSQSNPEITDEYKEKHGYIHEYTHRERPIVTLPQLLLSYVGNVLLHLPADGAASFDVFGRDKKGASFGTLMPPASSIETLDTHIQYVEGMMNKLEGNAVLFVDVAFTPEGYIMNLR